MHHFRSQVFVISFHHILFSPVFSVWFSVRFFLLPLPSHSCFDDADANHPGCGDDVVATMLLRKTCHSDTGATSSSPRISYSRPYPFLIVVLMIIDCSCWCWCWCWLLFVLIFVVFPYSSLPWGISDEHTVVRPLLLSTLRLVFLVRIFG